MAKKEQPEYYTILFERYIELVTESDRYYYMVAEELKNLIAKTEVAEWENSPIPDFMETIVILHSLRTFLDKKINEPTDEEIKFCNENKIKDVLVSKEELVMLQKFVMALEEQKALLFTEYKFSHLTN
jgi:hypothetical protein